VVEFFQLWCPGCNKFSIPLMSHWHKEFAEEIADGRLVLISIHTVFEGHDYQNNDRLREFVREKGMQHSVAVDQQSPVHRLPDTMRAYNTGGTPEMAFIDRRGRLRYQKFGWFDPDWATGLIGEMLYEKSGS